MELPEAAAEGCVAHAPILSCFRVRSSGARGGLGDERGGGFIEGGSRALTIQSGVKSG